METVAEPRSGRPDLLELPPLYSAVSFGPTHGNLKQQRKETAALRDLFYFRAQHQQKLGGPQSNNPRGFPDTGYKTRDTARPRISRRIHHLSSKPHPHHHHQSIPSLPTLSPTYPAAVEHSSKEEEEDIFPTTTAVFKSSQKTNTAPHLPQPNSQTKSSGRGKNRQRQTTVMTSRRQRRKSSGTCGPSFRALTQLCSRPLPQLLEGPVRSLTLQSPFPRDLQAWQNEVVKVAPVRPGFVLPLTPAEGRFQKPESTRYPYKVQSLHPATHFYRSWSKITLKDYVIHPEWSSEKQLRMAQ